MNQHNDAATQAFDAIAQLCDCPAWDYPGQIVRDVENLCARAQNDAISVKLLTKQLNTFIEFFNEHDVGKYTDENSADELVQSTRELLEKI